MTIQKAQPPIASAPSTALIDELLDRLGYQRAQADSFAEKWVRHLPGEDSLYRLSADERVALHSGLCDAAIAIADANELDAR